MRASPSPKPFARMKNILTIFGIFLLGACTQNNTTENVHTSYEIMNSSFHEYFDELDTTRTDNTIGCVSGFFKKLDANYVIRIVPNLDLVYNSIEKYEIKGFTNDLVLELFEYKEGKANLTNICTDILVVNNPEPIQKYSNCKGTVVIGKSNPTQYYGNEMPRVSIHLKNLIFYDSLGNEVLKIKDELLWKVLHLGTPG